ncbi:response regulator transcription factor [Phaeobacter sp. B1627]|uniref:response regulator transcription factor n=1 Tax=Phaeobacter sp. B1627 TaxID=2583809 RepID=UPI00111A1D8C|nr:response regulator transcription factor [Phaeobacter sp. B1627]TNJ40597.1 response regulator transcription factor [Phaeobacter sp. B1627]
MKHSTFAMAQGGSLRVMIVDDHPLYRDALTAAVERIFPDVVIETAGTLRASLEKLDRGFQPDLVMFDLKLPDVAGISGFMNLRNRLPDRPILVISSLASPEVARTLIDEGAAGFMPKDCSAQELKSLLLEIAEGRKVLPKEYQNQNFQPTQPPAPGGAFPNDLSMRLEALTVQQQRVLRLICAGKPNKQIAYELDLAEATVKAHITALLRRLGVKNRTQAAVLLEAMKKPSPGMEPETQSFLAK